jgi:hypothetical protein
MESLGWYIQQPTTNNQHPTSNIQCLRKLQSLDVECWLLVVGCSLSLWGGSAIQVGWGGRRSSTTKKPEFHSGLFATRYREQI